MAEIFLNKHILLGVTGSIAAYKAAEIASRLTQEGALVDVILTESAVKFVSPLTFQSVTGRKAYTEADLWGGEGHVTHIGLGKVGDLLVIAPASANTIAKLANGIADNLLTVSALAARCPLLVAPAMDGGMFNHPATQENIKILESRGVTILGPSAGHLASGMVGVGRLVETSEIIGNIRWLLSRPNKLAGKHFLVSAGGTYEDIDPVRRISNRSSGKQGFAIAQAALDAGADVTLLAANSILPTPFGAKRVDVCSAADLQEKVLALSLRADVVVMTAAVADFRPRTVASEKIKRGTDALTITLEPTDDILKSLAAVRKVGSNPKIVVGFAAESQNLLENAQKKLLAKKLDMLVANDISAVDSGFNVDKNRVTLLYPNGKVDQYPLIEKIAVAEIIVEKIAEMII